MYEGTKLGLCLKLMIYLNLSMPYFYISIQSFSLRNMVKDVSQPGNMLLDTLVFKVNFSQVLTGLKLLKKNARHSEYILEVQYKALMELERVLPKHVSKKFDIAKNTFCLGKE